MVVLSKPILIFMHWVITNEFILSRVDLLCIGLSQMNLFSVSQGLYWHSFMLFFELH